MSIKKILLIEDDAGLRENTAEILGLSNYAVLQAENGAIGIELALRERPDLIICDIQMPVMDGYAVIHALQQNPASAAIPLIFLTARAEPAEIRRGMSAGADDYLTKPFEGIELLQAIDSCFKRRDSRKRPSPAPAKWLDAKESDDVKLLPAALGTREVHFYKKKHILYREGQRPAFVYYIVSGRLKVYKTDIDGKEFITHLGVPGDFVGYSAVLEEGPYQESAQVLEDAGLVNVPRQEFVGWLSSDHEIAARFLRLLSKDVTEKEASLLHFAYHSLRKRVANGLLQLMEKSGAKGKERNGIAISRENLSHLIASATESLTRTLGDFRRERLIDIRNGRIYILNEEKLRKLVN
jgi:CRP/FNR family cyclic AMP-dependent transcriptional regulator